MLFTLNDGYVLPAVGFGTYKLKGSDGVESIVEALNNGYRLLDSAFNYENEGTVGAALSRSGLKRSEVFLTSKLPGRRHSYDQALETIEESVYRTGVDFYDLYLIHWPNPREGKFVEAWKALIEAQKRGLVKSIGVCNFLGEHIDLLIEETGVVPAVNQIELHPYFNQDAQRAYNASKGIVTQAWSPLGRQSGILEDETLVRLANKYKKTVAQLVLRWEVQLNVLPIPKAKSTKRQIENRSIFDFEISTDDMLEISALTRVDGRLQDQDPAFYQEM